MIEITNLTKIYQVNKAQMTALRDVNLTIQRGSIHGIIGLSGAGKSSLIRCINRIEEINSGQVKIDGVNIQQLNQAQLRQLRKSIGMIFQSFNLLSSKTVFENVALPLKLAKVPKQTIPARVKSLLQLVGLQDKQGAYPAMLSGGQKQRVGIARALANKPTILLCDEATSALDPKTTRQILTLLKDINNTLGLTIIVVTHEMEVIKAICDYVTILEGGRVVEEGLTKSIFTNPNRKITRQLLGMEALATLQQTKSRVLQLTFCNKSASQPIISRVISKFAIEVNILAGQIEAIGDETIGRLVVAMDTEPTKMSQIISYLQDNEVIVEVVSNG